MDPERKKARREELKALRTLLTEQDAVSKKVARALDKEEANLRSRLPAAKFARHPLHRRRNRERERAASVAVSLGVLKAQEDALEAG